MKNVFVSSRLNCLTITIGYLVIGVIWAFYANKILIFLLPHRIAITQHFAGPCYWCFIVLSSGLFYLLLKYWGASQIETQLLFGKMERSLKSYSDCTKAMIKADNEIMLMEDVCRICVDVGGHRMAWVAFAENDAQKTLRPVAYWGEKGCFFENFHASWAETECGQGPIGTSIRTSEPVIFQNLMTNPRFETCREAAEKCGYGSCISLPLQDANQNFGALVIFDAKPNAFDKGGSLLLKELAEDLSYGIQILRLKVEHKHEIAERLMLAAVTDQTSDGVITFDVDGTIQYLNPSFIKLCGIPADEGLGVSIHDFECSKRNPEFYQAVTGAINTNSVRTGHFTNIDREGNEHDIDARISPVYDESGQIVRYVVTVIDVSHEVQLQRQLRQTQKMEALDTLSEGIAHDFNNILENILINSEMGLAADAADQPVQENLFQILKETLVGKKLIKQYMTIGQHREYPKQQVKISEVVKESMHSLEMTVPTTIVLKQGIVPGLGLIMGDRRQIHQVISILCANAIEAMQIVGGILEVNLTNMEISPERRSHHPNLISGEYVRLTITDTGEGMARDELECVFDPFYTTKIMKNGCGLGLSIAHGIIKNYGGEISVNSIVGVGTTFSILFPLLDTLRFQEEKNCRIEKCSVKGTIVY